MLTVGSLFSGIGGLDLGLERALGCRLAWACDADAHCRRVLASRWPDASIHEDVMGLVPGPCDILCGGFPCQDVSLAGKGAGLAGARSGLWFEMLRVVGLATPAFVVIENVGALVSRGLSVVADGLAGLGYAVEWQTITALSVGALHIRSRVFIVAHRMGRVGVFRDPGVVARAFASHRATCGGIWAAEPAGVPRTVTRAEMAQSVRRARLKALGNAVVPQVAEVVGACLRGAIDAPRQPVGWRAIGVVTDGEARSAPDLFGSTAPVAMPPCGALVDGSLYETRPLCDLRTAKARHAAAPGPFLRPMPTPTANDVLGAGYQRSGGRPFLTLPGAVGATAHLPPELEAELVARGLVPTPQAYSKGKPRNSEPGLTPLDIAVRGMYGRAGLLPTPTATEYGANRGWERDGPERPSLGTMARRGLGPLGVVPTPRASDWRSGRTSAATRTRNARPLCEVVAAAQDADCRVRVHRRRHGRMLGVVAVRVVRNAEQARPSGHLNPEWVAWLMGFPAGWFDATSDHDAQIGLFSP